MQNKERLSLQNTRKTKTKTKMSPTTDTSVVVVHCKFASEDESKTISISLPPSVPATVRKVCEQFLSERADVQQLIQKKGGTFEGFNVCALPRKEEATTTTTTTTTIKTKKEEDEEERNQSTINGLSVSEASTVLDDAKVLQNNDRVTMALTKEYNLKSLNPVRKYTVGSFHGTNLPKFKSGKQAAVEWQMRRTIDEANPTVASGLSLVGGKRQAFVGAKEKGQSAKFYILKAQNTNDFCALPMETWYNFRQLMSRKVLNLEEAEELMKNKQDRLYETSAKFVGSGANNADLDRFSDSDSEDDIVNPKSRRNKKRGDDTDDEDEENGGKKRGRKRGGGGGKKKGDDEDETKEKNEDGIGEGWEHDQTYSDDEGGEVMATADPEQQEIDKQNAPKPPTADSDDELDENAQKIKTLLTRQNAIENNITAAAIFSDDDDDDDDDDIPEDFDPDKEEVNIGKTRSLIDKVKQKEVRDKQAAKEAAAAAKEATAEQQRRALAQQQQLQQEQLQQQATAAAQGVKRTASQAGMTSQENSARKSAQRPLSRGASALGVGGDKLKDESATNPVEKIIRELLKKNPGRTTMKDITKACRKAGLVSSDAGKAQLKQTIERILRFSQTSDGVMVVALK